MCVPQQWFVCETCDGSGAIGRRITVYEHGCGFPHDDVEESPCPECGGAGGRIDDVVAESATAKGSS